MGNKSIDLKSLELLVVVRTVDCCRVNMLATGAHKCLLIIDIAVTSCCGVAFVQCGTVEHAPLGLANRAWWVTQCCYSSVDISVSVLNA